jgi:hypothetical protein
MNITLEEVKKLYLNKTENELNFIKRGIETHGTKYDYSKVKYIPKSNNVIIICPIHGEFEQYRGSHLLGNGCWKCGVNVRAKHCAKTTEEFIQESKAIFGDKYDYSKVEYKTTHIKVILICPIHGDFVVAPAEHISKVRGCQKCRQFEKINNVLSSTKNDFIRKTNEMYNGRYTYDLSNYVNANSKIMAHCSLHGDFEITATKHISKANKCCTQCLLDQKHELKNITLSKFIKDVKKMYGNTFNFSKVVLEDLNHGRNITLVCKKHGNFAIDPARLLIAKYGCPSCNGSVDHKIISYQSFVEFANKIHNNIYDYSKFKYVDSDTRGIIICSKHGAFLMSPRNHAGDTTGYKCQKCAEESRVKIRARSYEDFIEAANKTHAGKYQYPENVELVSNSTKIKVICPIHGEYIQSVKNHLQAGSGCPICRADLTRKSTEDFIKQANITHNNKYDYSLVEYENYKNKVKIICKKHGEFLQSPNTHLSGSGCPACSSSKGELRIGEVLMKMKVQYIPQYKIDECRDVNSLPFDFAVFKENKLKVLIEFQGQQHYEPIEYFNGYEGFEYTKKHDKIKEEYCTQNNIELLTIKYDKYDTIEEQLRNIL